MFANACPSAYQEKPQECLDRRPVAPGFSAPLKARADPAAPVDSHTWNRHYEVYCGAKGPKVRHHLRIERGHGGIESVDLIEMKAQQEAMVLRDPAAKSLAELPR
jgi:hypothetical protein